MQGLKKKKGLFSGSYWRCTPPKGKNKPRTGCVIQEIDPTCEGAKIPCSITGSTQIIPGCQRCTSVEGNQSRL